MAQTAADALGVPVDRIDAKIGDSSLPPAPLGGGSQKTASIHPATLVACVLLRKAPTAIAIANPEPKLNGRKPEEIGYAGGKMFLIGDNSKSDTYIIDRLKRVQRYRL